MWSRRRCFLSFPFSSYPVLSPSPSRCAPQSCRRVFRFPHPSLPHICIPFPCSRPRFYRVPFPPTRSRSYRRYTACPPLLAANTILRSTVLRRDLNQAEGDKARKAERRRTRRNSLGYRCAIRGVGAHTSTVETECAFCAVYGTRRRPFLARDASR
jgi:hypothetical protein